MGQGDVKFLAVIGAFLGPQAIFFVILAPAILGSAIGLIMQRE
ncbi:MAG: prepilin peptidase [Verrucomicrobiia bacterium]